MHLSACVAYEGEGPGGAVPAPQGSNPRNKVGPVKPNELSALFSRGRCGHSGWCSGRPNREVATVELSWLCTT